MSDGNSMNIIDAASKRFKLGFMIERERQNSIDLSR